MKKGYLGGRLIVNSSQLSSCKNYPHEALSNSY